MCEMFVVVGEAPFRLGDVWTFAEALERYGIAGFGWGAAWWGRDGGLELHVDTRAMRDDPARAGLAPIETTAALVHLRRPSRLSTVGRADTQPFLDRAGRFAFGHNGDFRPDRPWRERYRAEGRIHGRADSEVGLRWLEDNWDRGGPSLLLPALHDELAGQANIMVLGADGSAWGYAGNGENPVFDFRLGELRMLSTGIYSLDRSLFRYVARGDVEIRPVRDRGVLSLTAGVRPAVP